MTNFSLSCTLGQVRYHVPNVSSAWRSLSRAVCVAPGGRETMLVMGPLPFTGCQLDCPALSCSVYEVNYVYNIIMR